MYMYILRVVVGGGGGGAAGPSFKEETGLEYMFMIPHFFSFLKSKKILLAPPPKSVRLSKPPPSLSLPLHLRS